MNISRRFTNAFEAFLFHGFINKGAWFYWGTAILIPTILYIATRYNHGFDANTMVEEFLIYAKFGLLPLFFLGFDVISKSIAHFIILNKEKAIQKSNLFNIFTVIAVFAMASYTSYEKVSFLQKASGSFLNAIDPHTTTLKGCGEELKQIPYIEHDNDTYTIQCPRSIILLPDYEYTISSTHIKEVLKGAHKIRKDKLGKPKIENGVITYTIEDEEALVSKESENEISKK